MVRSTRAPASLPDIGLGGTTNERMVLVPNLAEKVDAVCSCEQRRGDRVHGCVPPTLFGQFEFLFGAVGGG
jgi:hypothetical protein